MDMISKPAKSCPYDPNEPLTTSLKIALENQHTFTQLRIFPTIIGPLVKDVCETLNISVENTRPKVVTSTVFIICENYIHTCTCIGS